MESETGEFTALSDEALKAALTQTDAGIFGANAHYYARIGSTNDAARHMAEQGAPEGALVIADEQTAGRGRMGRRWKSQPNANLIFSIIFRPTLAAEFAHRVVMACGLGIAEGCEQAAPVKVDVKWPNDLLIGGKKLAGILPESAISGERLQWVVVGMGINVNQIFDAGDRLRETATSLRAETDQIANRAGLLACILSRLKEWHTHLDHEQLLTAWRKRCVTLGQRIRVETRDGILTGEAVDISEKGDLLIKADAGKLHHLHLSEATILRESG